MCIDTRLPIPAASAASWRARLSWRGVASYRANTKGLPNWVASFVLATWFKVVATAAVIA